MALVSFRYLFGALLLSYTNSKVDLRAGILTLPKSNSQNYENILDGWAPLILIIVGPCIALCTPAKKGRSRVHFKL